MSNPTLGTEHRQAIFRQYINLCFTYIKLLAVLLSSFFTIS